MPDNYNPLKMAGEVDDSMLPDRSGDYKAYGRQANKPIYHFHCDVWKEGIRTFQYVHIDSDSRFSVGKDGQVIRIAFAGLKPVQITIKGTNLKMLYDYIVQHRMPWVMEVEPNREFGQREPKDPIITKIDVEEIKGA